MDVDIPWHRVINAKGEISQRSEGQGDSEQHVRLLAEGVIPNKHGRIKLNTYRWQPVFEDFLSDQLEDDEFWRDQPGIG
jgi:methylated-DNA-protein-cysteine methyltransferase-like protein